MFQRKPLREDLHKEILSRISDGRLPAGHRINETHLSRDLGISRTPLREAMLGLEALGFLTSVMGRGFVVPALDIQEFADIQAVLVRLKPLAMGQSFPLPPGRIMEIHNLLARAKRKVAQAGPQIEHSLVDLVFRYAQLVLGTCANPVLKADIGRLDGMARRYWHEAFLHGYDPGDFLQSHDQLYDFLRADRRDDAVSHWQGHIEQFSAEAARFLPTPAGVYQEGTEFSTG